MLISLWTESALVLMTLFVMISGVYGWRLHRKVQKINASQQLLVSQCDAMQHQMQTMSQSQLALQQQMERLAGDIIQQAVYRQDGSRHLSAINAVRSGQLDQDLIRQHGLSSDAAALLIALHTDAQGNVTATEAR